MNTEIDRFAEDLESSDQLCQELADFSGNFDDLAGWLNDKGYRINAGEIAAIISAKLDGLSDEELDGVSGGTGVVKSLQQGMSSDRRAKVTNTLSNAMKKIGSTQDTIVGNIR